jgi:hypothetical protein
MALARGLEPAPWVTQALLAIGIYFFVIGFTDREGEGRAPMA